MPLHKKDFFGLRGMSADSWDCRNDEIYFEPEG